MEWLTMERWSPYAVGVGIGILSWIAFVLSDKPIGCSTAFTRTSGMLERLLLGRKVHDKPYYQKFTPHIDWEWMLVVGVILGALLSSKLSKTFGIEWVPAQWQAAAGDSGLTRWAVALLGGIVMGIGSRWAGGCTSGHGISGTLQLAVSSWLAALSFFAGGIATAMLIYRVLL